MQARKYWAKGRSCFRRWCLIWYKLSWLVRANEFTEREFNVEWQRGQITVQNVEFRLTAEALSRSVYVRVCVCARILSNKLTRKIMIPCNRSTPLTSMKTKESEWERTRAEIERGYATCVYFNYMLLSNQWITSCLSSNMNKIVVMQEISNCH